MSNVLSVERPRLDCPPWCTVVDHPAELTLDLETGLRCHAATVRTVHIVAGSTLATIDVTAVDDLTAGRRTPAGVMVQADEVMTPSEARQLAGALLAAAEIADGRGRDEDHAAALR